MNDRISLKEVVTETLGRMMNQDIIEKLDIPLPRTILIKTGSPASVDFYKAVEFIEFVLKVNGLVISREPD